MNPLLVHFLMAATARAGDEEALPPDTRTPEEREADRQRREAAWAEHEKAKQAAWEADRPRREAAQAKQAAEYAERQARRDKERAEWVAQEAKRKADEAEAAALRERLWNESVARVAARNAARKAKPKNNRAHNAKRRK